MPIDISDDTDSAKRAGQRRASVLMPLVMRDRWHVILTLRSESMKSHPGQISFPGGKREGDETALAAALRETQEEIGVAPYDVDVLGRLPSFDAVSKFRVTPFVGIVKPSAQITSDPSEVADVFEVPLDFLMNADSHVPREVFFDGRDHTMIDMPYDQPDGTHRRIWGMTAMMIYRLYQRSFA